GRSSQQPIQQPTRHSRTPAAVNTTTATAPATLRTKRDRIAPLRTARPDCPPSKPPLRELPCPCPLPQQRPYRPAALHRSARAHWYAPQRALGGGSVAPVSRTHQEVASVASSSSFDVVSKTDTQEVDN